MFEPLELPDDWQEALSECIGSPEYKMLLGKIDKEYEVARICPPRNQVFATFKLCPLNSVKAVILGQDPYFNPGQAMGLAFSVNHYCKQFPPSLKNIIKEVRTELGVCTIEDGDLTPWAKQGVLLLNTCLTVREGTPLSHKDIGWDCLINHVLKVLNKKDNIVFVLWGNSAKAYRPLLTNSNNLILTSAHPSPLSANAGFFGCGHFKKINDFLTSRGSKAIIF